MKKSAKIALGAVLCAAAAAAGAYFGDAVYFDGRFPYLTSLNGIDVSCMTAAEARRALEASYDGYRLKVSGRGGLSEEITGEEIGLTPVPQQSPEEMLGGTDPFAWPASLLRRTEFTTQVKGVCDREALSARVRSLTFLDPENVRLPGDARVVYEDGSFTVRQDDGAFPDGRKILELVGSALESFAGEVDLESGDVYRRPAVGEDDPALKREAEAMNAYAGTVVDLPVGEDGEEIDGSVYRDWFEEDEDGDLVIGEDGRAVLDPGKVADYVDSLADRYDTYGKTHTFTTTDGDVIEIENGSYGWQIDRARTAELIAAAVESGESGVIEPVYLHTARSHGEKDYGDSYVEVNLDAQHVYVYVNGEIAVETDCVSGKAIGGAATPPGIFSVFGMARNTVLRGEGYASPVSYWMPFNRNIGLHDANWRGRFGSDLYVNGGSHGCVNLPVAKAGEVYANVEIGTPVIVYGGLDREGAAAYNKAKASGEVGSVLEYIRGEETAEKILLAREQREEARLKAEEEAAAKAEKEAAAKAEKERTAKAEQQPAGSTKQSASPGSASAPKPAAQSAPAPAPAPQQSPAVAAAVAQANAAQAAYDQAQATLGAAQAASAAAPADEALKAVVQAAQSQADQARQALDAANLAAYEAALAAGQ